MTEQRRALAQTKVSRQQRIVTILTRQEIGSQSQLAQLLAAEPTSCRVRMVTICC